MLDSHGFENISTIDLVNQLEKHPQLKARIKAMLDVVENASGDVVKADEAEQRFIEELRQMGLEAMQAWAERKQSRVEAESDSCSDLTRKQKKEATGTHASAKSK
jgi:hypothetical protein